MTKKTERVLEEDLQESFRDAMFGRRRQRSPEEALGEAADKTTKDQPGDPRDDLEPDHGDDPEWV